MIKLKQTGGNLEVYKNTIKGDDGGYYIPVYNKGHGLLYWTRSKEDMEDIKEAYVIKGEDGISPTVKVDAHAGYIILHITDANRTQSYVIRDGYNGLDGRGIKDIKFMANLGCYKMEYTDNTFDYFPGIDESISNRYSFLRDDFNSYSTGNFQSVQDGNYIFPNSTYNNGVSYDIVKEGNNNILRASFIKNEAEGGRGRFWWYPKPSGEFVFTCDYRPSDDTSGLALLPIDNIRANVEGGTNKCRLFNTKKSKGSPYIQGITIKAGVWYRIKVEVLEEAVYFKIWERDTGTEPSRTSSTGITKFLWSDMEHTNLKTRHQAHFIFRPYKNSNAYFDIDNFEIYREM